jgi:hypothetical protein
MANWFADFAPRSVRLMAMVAAVTMSAVLLPGIYRGWEGLQKAKDRVAQTRAALATAAAAKSRLEAAVADQKAQQVAALQLAANDERIVDVWRKQMLAWSLMRGIDVTISSRGPSPYQGAVKLVIRIGNASPARLLQTLDFLQLFGFLESYAKGEAVLHVSLKGASDV